jgi:adenylate kinase family enzyme
MRVRYFFTGKPGVGKSLLADKLALVIPSVKISPTSLTQALLDDPSLFSKLTSGQETTPSDILEEIGKQVSGEESSYKGYILDGIPILSIAESIISFKNILLSGTNEFINVMVHLSIEDEVLVRRRAAQWLDPKSNF